MSVGSSICKLVCILFDELNVLAISPKNNFVTLFLIAKYGMHKF